MNKEAIEKLKRKILVGLDNIYNINYKSGDINFNSYLNAYILLVTKLNQTLIEDHVAILNSISNQTDKPNIINVVNGVAQLGFVTKIKKNHQAQNKIKFPCLVMKGKFFDRDNVKIFFRENNSIISYNPFNNSYASHDNLHIDKSYEVYTFSPFDEEEFSLNQGVLKFLGRSWFSALLARFKYIIAKLIITSIVLHLFSLALPLYIIYIYDRVVLAHDVSNLALVTFGVIFLFICEQVLRYFRSSVLSWLGSRVDYIVTNEVLSKLNKLPLGIIEKLSLPSQIARIRSFSSLRDFFTGPIFSTVLELPAIVLMIILVSYIHIFFTIAFVAGFVLLTICLIIFHKILSGQIKKATALNTEKYYLTSIYLDKLSTLHYQGLEQYYIKKLEHLSENTAYYNLKSDCSSSFVDHYGKLITNTGILVTLCTGIYLISLNEINVAALLATIFLAWRIFAPIQVASSTVIRSEKLLKTISQINKFLTLPDEFDNHDILIGKSINIKGNIKFSNVGVFYTSNRNFILRNFSLEIGTGQLVVIQGKSGSGKSTLLKLVSGSIKPNIGKVLIDKYDISQLNIHSLRKQVCFVHKSDLVIPGTIYENIQIVNPFLTKNSIKEILEHLKLTEEFYKLPDRLNTYISVENHHYFSKKILKYISLAKIYAGDHPIKLIDNLSKESFSQETWNIFLDDIRMWKKTSTILIVSDELTLSSMADNVIDLANFKKSTVTIHGNKNN